jgi:hypothetical protein
MAVSCHYPWPGLGHVVKTGEGFHYVPQPMTMVLLNDANVGWVMVRPRGST